MRVGWFILFFLWLVACGPAATVQPTAVPHSLLLPTPTTTQTEVDISNIPAVDRSQHTVPLAEIYFDTFRRTNRVVPLSEADESLIVSLRDAIPPIYNPVFETAAAANNWLTEDDIVLGYADGEEAYAYPIKILNWHEMVSHEVNGRPILSTY